jgi:hypothetical protein
VLCVGDNSETDVLSHLDLPGQHRSKLRRRVVGAGDTQQSTHAGDRVLHLVIAHEPEPCGGIVFVSRANQAAAFESRETGASSRHSARWPPLAPCYTSRNEQARAKEVI